MSDFDNLTLDKLMETIKALRPTVYIHVSLYIPDKMTFDEAVKDGIMAVDVFEEKVILTHPIHAAAVGHELGKRYNIVWGFPDKPTLKERPFVPFVYDPPERDRLTFYHRWMV